MGGNLSFTKLFFAILLTISISSNSWAMSFCHDNGAPQIKEVTNHCQDKEPPSKTLNCNTCLVCISAHYAALTGESTVFQPLKKRPSVYDAATSPYNLVYKNKKPPKFG